MECENDNSVLPTPLHTKPNLTVIIVINKIKVIKERVITEEADAISQP